MKQKAKRFAYVSIVCCVTLSLLCCATYATTSNNAEQSVEKGLTWLSQSQNSNGSWDELTLLPDEISHA